MLNAIMPPISVQHGLNDAEVAAVATCVRAAWGNGASAVGEALMRSKR